MQRIVGNGRRHDAPRRRRRRSGTAGSSTGDLCRRGEDGYFIHIGRRDEVIRRRGENILGAEIDRVQKFKLREDPALLRDAIDLQPRRTAHRHLEGGRP